MRHTLTLLSLLSLAVGGCTSSHVADADGGVRCGAATCAAGQVCCNASCGICTAPGEACPTIACVDGGPTPATCGGEVCGGGETCCSACPGDPDFCGPAPCPRFRCPPPPVGCETCGAGELCCPSCPGEPSLCVSGSDCPAIACPVPSCEGCADGLCCTGCPGDPPFCVSGDMCPAFDCPPRECDTCAPGAPCCDGCPGEPSFCGTPDGGCPDIACPPPPPPSCADGRSCADSEYCAQETCGGEGRCEPRPSGCPRDCPGVCGCDGETHCNACTAAARGVSVAHDGACGPVGVCEGRDYCDCSGECDPLVDLTTGCICPCDDPFNCTGETCACACGGATYLGCAERGRCAETEVHCGAGCSATLDPDGCPVCACSTPGG